MNPISIILPFEQLRKTEDIIDVPLGISHIYTLKKLSDLNPKIKIKIPIIINIILGK